MAATNVEYATLSQLKSDEETCGIRSANYRSVQFCTDSGGVPPQKYTRSPYWLKMASASEPTYHRKKDTRWAARKIRK